MQKQEQAAWVREGRCALGIELGSTRIKAVLIGPDHAPIAIGQRTTGKTGWRTGYGPITWTMSGRAFRTHTRTWPADTQETPRRAARRAVGAVGVSAMMHGYLPFDADGQPAGPLPHLAQHHDRQGRGGADGAVFASTFPSAGASRTCIRPS